MYDYGSEGVADLIARTSKHTNPVDATSALPQA